MTVNSHDFGVSDEWQRYFGIFTSYDYFFRIYGLLLLASFFYTLLKFFYRKSSYLNFETKRLLILMIFFLFLTPSKWGWYVVPILGLLSINIALQLQNDKRFKYAISLIIYFLTFWVISNNEFWKRNPSINNSYINPSRDWQLDLKITALCFVSLFVVLLILDYLIKKEIFFNTSLTFLLVVNLIGIISPNNLDKIFKNQNFFAWNQYSSSPCSFMDTLQFYQITEAVEEQKRDFQEATFFPKDDDQVMINGLNRYTFPPNSQNMSLEVLPDSSKNHFSFAIRGQDLSKIKIEFLQGNDKIPINFIKDISDGALWQIIEPIPLSTIATKVLISSSNQANNLEVTDPFFVDKISMSDKITKTESSIFLGPEQIYLGNCLESPVIRAGVFQDPDLVIGNANSGSAIFGNDYKLRVVNNCWAPKENASIDDCVVQWIY